MSRESFLSRVKKAAQAGRSYRVRQIAIPEGCGYLGASREGLCDALAAEITAVGGAPHVVSSWSEAREELRSLLEEYRPKTALCWRHQTLEELELGRLMKECDVKSIDDAALREQEPSQQRETILAADIGISSADVAVAETGSLLLCSQPGRERFVSLLPPVHVAVVHQRQIAPDLFDAIGHLQKDENGVNRQPPSNAVFITGPSKTGDIELQLTTGVHGPGKWHVIVVRETA